MVTYPLCYINDAGMEGERYFISFGPSPNLTTFGKRSRRSSKNSLFMRFLTILPFSYCMFRQFWQEFTKKDYTSPPECCQAMYSSIGDTHPPTISCSLHKVEEINKMLDLIHTALHKRDKYNKTWRLWDMCVLSEEGKAL